MIKLPKALVDKFNDWLEREAVDARRHGEYRKWLRYYLDFCHKYGHGYLQVGDCRLLGEITLDYPPQSPPALHARSFPCICSGGKS